MATARISPGAVTFINSRRGVFSPRKRRRRMWEPMDRFVAKLRSRQALSNEDEALLRDAGWAERRYGRHDTIVRPGEALTSCHLLLNGFVARCHEDGSGARQIIGLGVAGDLLDIHGVVLGRLDHELVALGPCDVASIPHARVREMTGSPALQKIIWLQAAIEHVIQAAWIQALGRKRGVGKIAHIFCEMQLRLGLVGIATRMGFPLPLSQQEMADYAGMTHVHLNRCLKELREARLVSFASGWAKVEDWEELKRMARFDDGYLNLRLIDL
jgi:CRP-like cAMP-binding protein